MAHSLTEKIVQTQVECTDLKASIESCQNIVSNFDEGASPPECHEEIFYAKVVKLLAEVNMQKNQEFLPPLNHPLAVSTFLVEELDETIASSEQMLKVIEMRCNSLDKTIEEKEYLIIQQKQINQAMLRHLEETSQSENVNDDSDVIKAYHAELTSKKNKCDRKQRETKKKMSAFLQKHFPAPNARQLTGGTTNISSMMLQQRTTSLEHTIDDLISLAVNRPENPYLSLGSQHWGQHVELLLSYGIAKRHPSDANKIKMTEMHF